MKFLAVFTGNLTSIKFINSDTGEVVDPRIVLDILAFGNGKVVRTEELNGEDEYEPSLNKTIRTVVTSQTWEIVDNITTAQQGVTADAPTPSLLDVNCSCIIGGGVVGPHHDPACAWYGVPDEL